MSSNVILFPVSAWIDGWWWHGGKKYKDMGQLKADVSAKDWARAYQISLQQFLRNQLARTTQQRRQRSMTATFLLAFLFAAVTLWWVFGS